ncbi:MAG: hypothetical protein ACYTFI_00895 [Planctomycetota bacterium]|jgi:hypothetical protein
MRLRAEVDSFAAEMERELQANDHKGGWKDCSPWPLFAEMTNHKRALQRSVGDLLAMETDVAMGSHGDLPKQQQLIDRIRDDAADVANFAMMIADVCGAL